MVSDTQPQPGPGGQRPRPGHSEAVDGASGPREPPLPGPSHVSAFRKPSHPHPVSSPKKKYSSLSRRKGMRPEVNGDQSDPDLPSFDRLPIRPELQRPDSVITTSSVVSSEAEASVIEEADTEAEAGLSSLPPPAPPSVYTISGLYGSSVPVKTKLGESLDPGDQQPRTHKRSASTMATSIVIRGCQKTHKRSHSHTVGYGQPPHGPGGHGGGHYHRRTGSSGFVMGHRRTVSGASAIVDTLEKITGGHSRLSLNTSTSDYLHGIQAERRASSRIQDATAEEESEDEDMDNLEECGIYRCTPACAQPLSNIKLFVFLMSILVILQQALSSGYLNSVITTIEIRYEIPSSVSGVIASMFEIGNVGTVIFVSYLGSSRHIPSIIGTGALLIGLGSIIFSFPHFFTENYSDGAQFAANATDENICKISYAKNSPSILEKLQLGELDELLDPENVNGLSSPPLGPHNHQFSRDDNCIKEGSKSSALPIFIFMMAQLLIGSGGSPLFTLGTAYIDDHVKKDAASVYIGFMYAMVAFGPVLGFLLGAYMLKVYVDAFVIDPAKLLMDSGSRHWVGMWWGGFLIIGVLMLLVALPFFAFPKEMKKEKRKVYLDEKYRKQEQVANSKEKSATGSKVAAAGDKVRAEGKKDENYGKNLADLPKCIWKLITNWIFLVSCLGACCELIIVSGFIVFLPKYLETQFNLSKSEASMLTGGTAIPGACIGIILGGYILKKLQLGPKGAVQLVLICNVLCLCCYGLLFFLGCNNVAMAGATMPYSSSSPGEGFQINLTHSCNFGCECDMNDVQPVCGANGLTYFSPCHAGCTSLLSSDNYTNCACVSDGAGQSSDLSVTKVPVATKGPCYTPCDMILPFMVLLFFMTLLVAITQMPVVMIVLRSVGEEEKAFALGIQFVIFRLFGYIPSPILFGHVIDTTCLLWTQTCEGSGGRCLIYDIEMFRFKYVGICAGIKLLSLFISSFDWWLIAKKELEEVEEITGKESGEKIEMYENSSLDKQGETETQAGYQSVALESPAHVMACPAPGPPPLHLGAAS